MPHGHHGGHGGHGHGGRGWRGPGVVVVEQPVGERVSQLSFRDDREKLAAMIAGAEADGQKGPIRELALRLTRAKAADDWRGQIQELHRFVRDGIRYVHDPNRREQLADALTVLSRGADDCDGKARLLAALGLSLGIETKIWPKWKGSRLVHVQVAFKAPGSEKWPGARADGWVIADPTIKGAELGEDPLSKPRNPGTGQLPLV